MGRRYGRTMLDSEGRRHVPRSEAIVQWKPSLGHPFPGGKDTPDAHRSLLDSDKLLLNLQFTGQVSSAFCLKVYHLYIWFIYFTLFFISCVIIIGSKNYCYITLLEEKSVVIAQFISTWKGAPFVLLPCNPCYYSHVEVLHVYFIPKTFL